MGFRKGTEIPGPGREQPAEDLPTWRPCQVETYSGHRVHEQPRRFTFQGDWLEVRRVLDRWREPEVLCFSVAAQDSRHYLLKYRPQADTWEVRLWRASEPTPG